MAKQPDEGVAERNREILRLRFEQLQPMTEIADRYRLSMASVKKIIRLAVANGMDLEFTPDPEADRPDRRRVLDNKPIDARNRAIGYLVWYWREVTTRQELRQAALKLSMSDNRLRRIEQGVCRDLRLDELVLFAGILGVTLEELVSDKPRRPNGEGHKS